jgi:hypothetical protein
MMRAWLVTFALVPMALSSAPGDVKVVMRPVTSFGYLDTNKDSVITPQEAKADWAVAQGFERADANHDGLLDKDEFETLQKG